MPKKLEEALRKSARKKGLTGKRKDAYVFGTLEKHKRKTRKDKGMKARSVYKKRVK